MHDKVSVIVPIYNSEYNLKKCIESIQKQTINNLEIILLNDGSNDNSKQICLHYANLDSRIFFVDKKNQGVSCTRNLGLKLAKGKYIVFVDSDDFIEKNYCEFLYNDIEKDNTDLAICGFNILANKKDILIYDKVNVLNELELKDFFQLYKRYHLNSPCNKIFINKIIKENSIKFNEHLSLGEDLLFTLDYIKACNGKIKVRSYPLYNYVRSENEGLHNIYYENLHQIYIYLYTEIYNSMTFLKADISKYKKEFYTSYLGMLNSCLNNTFDTKCNLNFWKKINHNNNILKSVEFKKCLKYSDANKFNSKYFDLLKKENYIYIFLLKKIINVKVKVQKYFSLKIKVFLYRKEFE